MRQITKYDYGYSNEYQWQHVGKYTDRNGYNFAKKLSQEQIEKFETLNNLIGHEIDFKRGTKTVRAVVIAVSLPDFEATVYPSGQINPHTGREFATKYVSYPYSFNIWIIGSKGDSFWTRNIDNVTINNPIKSEDIDFNSHIKLGKFDANEKYRL